MTERERWIDYLRWLNGASEGMIAVAWAHGWRCPPEVMEEGKRRRAELGVTDDMLTPRRLKW